MLKLMFNTLSKYTLRSIDWDYVSKLRVGVVCSRFAASLLWRAGVECIRYVGDFVTPQDVFSDVSLDLDDANSYDVVEARGNTLVVSSLARELNVDFFVRALRGCDVVIAHRYCDFAAKAAERLGIPLIPTAVTCVLPEDADRVGKVVELPRNPMLYSLLCSAQVLEALKLCTSGDAVIAPEALIPVEREPFFEGVVLW